MHRAIILAAEQPLRIDPGLAYERRDGFDEKGGVDHRLAPLDEMAETIFLQTERGRDVFEPMTRLPGDDRPDTIGHRLDKRVVGRGKNQRGAPQGKLGICHTLQVECVSPEQPPMIACFL